MSLDFRIIFNQGSEEIYNFAMREPGAESGVQTQEWSVNICPARINIACTPVTESRIHKYYLDTFKMDFSHDLIVSIPRDELSGGFRIVRKLAHELIRLGYDFVIFYVDAEFLQARGRDVLVVVDNEQYKAPFKRFLDDLSSWFLKNLDIDPPLE